MQPVNPPGLGGHRNALPRDDLNAVILAKLYRCLRFCPLLHPDRLDPRSMASVRF